LVRTLATLLQKITQKIIFYFVNSNFQKFNINNSNSIAISFSVQKIYILAIEFVEFLLYISPSHSA